MTPREMLMDRRYKAHADRLGEPRVQRWVIGFWLLTNSEGGCYVDERTDRCASFDRAWSAAMRQAVAETALAQPFTRHDLRAKAGSDAEDLARAQELLDHASPGMTKRHYRRKPTTIKPTR